MADLTIPQVAAEQIDELWTVKDIAAFGKWAATYVSNSIVFLPGFPRPVRITENAKPRWIASQVKAWAATRVS